MMISIFRVILFASIFIHLLGARTNALWDEAPLLDRILRAEMVVVGKLVNVENNAILIRRPGPRGEKGFQVHLDIGSIQATNVLYERGPPGASPKARKLPANFPFACHSRSQPQSGGLRAWSFSYLNFEEGDEGVWILNQSHFVGYLAVTYPHNFLPIDSLIVVEKTIDKSVKATNVDSLPGN